MGMLKDTKHTSLEMSYAEMCTRRKFEEVPATKLNITILKVFCFRPRESLPYDVIEFLAPLCWKIEEEELKKYTTRPNGSATTALKAALEKLVDKGVLECDDEDGGIDEFRVSRP